MANSNVKFKNKVILFGLLFSLTSTFIVSCGDSEKEIPEAEKPEKANKIDPYILDSSSALNAKVGGKMFSIPSPIETMDLIKKAGKPFNPKLINAPENSGQYTTTFLKALAVGIYGADLGYAALFQQNSTCLSLFGTVEKLTQDLGLSAVFDKELVSDFIDGEQDQSKMLQQITKAYRNGDNFLKENQQTDISSLILAGGWIESMYFATSFAIQSSESLRTRIGEQKKSLISLIGLLEENRKEQGDNYESLLNDLKQLQEIFKEVETQYAFEKPEVIPTKKLTIITSKTTYNISEETLNKIHQKISEIRNNIVQ